MADYIVNIGTQFDTEGLRKYQQQAKRAGDDASKAFDNASKNVKKLDSETKSLANRLKDLGRTDLKNITSLFSDKTVRNVKMMGGALAIVGAAGAGAMAVFIRNTIEGEKSLALLNSALASTEHAAGYTSDQLVRMSKEFSNKSTFGTDEIIEATSRMLTYTDIVGEQFPMAMQASIDWATRYGVSVSQAAETIGKALQEPSRAASALSDQGFTFTKEFVEHLKVLEQSGRLAEAQSLMYDELKGSIEGTAEAMRNTFSGAVKGLKNAFADAMRGSNGSLDGITESINNLTDTLNDPKVQEGLVKLADRIIKIADATIKVTSELPEFADWVRWIATGTANTNNLYQLTEQLADYEQKLRDIEKAYTDLGQNIASHGSDSDLDYWIGLKNEILYTESAIAKLTSAFKSKPKTPTSGSTTPTFTPTPKVDNSAQRERNKLDQEYTRILKSLEPSLDTYTKAFLDINTLYATGKLDVERYHEALTKIADAEAAEKAAQLKQKMEEQKKAADDMLLRGNQMIQQAALQLQYETEMSAIINDGIVPGSDEWINKVLELNEQYRITQLILDGYSEAQAKQIANQEMLAERQRELNGQAMKQTDAYTDALITAGKHIGNAFSQMMAGQKVNFKNMIHQMAVDLAKSQLMKVLSQLGSSMGGGWGAMFSAIGGAMANGGAFSNGVQMFANGGVVNGITPFGMAGGKLGIMGEAGPEAIMPLKRGSDGKLGVAASGGGSSNISIVNNVTINGSDDPVESAELTTKALEKMMDSKIKQVIQDQKRTGNMLGQ